MMLRKHLDRWPFAVLAFFAALLFASLTANSTAQEPARLALLIGNKGYTAKVGRLTNPHNDVDLVAAALTKVGFKVTVIKDATYKQMDTALKRYVADVRRAGKGALSFFYYSGHGVSQPETQINYLIPVDVTDAEDDKVWFESLQQNAVIDLLSKQAPAATHYLVFDSCRNELNVSAPAAKALGADKGFVPVAAPSGLLIAHATADRRTASDAGDGGGPYAKVLAEEIVRPGVESVTMFRAVQIRVKQAIGQDPWLSFPALPAVYLAGKPDAVATPEPAALKAEQDARRRAEQQLAERDTVLRAEQAKRDAEQAQTNARIKALEQQLAANAAQQKVLPPPALVAPAPAKPAAVIPPPVSSKSTDAALTVTPGSGQSFRDCPTCPEMVVIPAGSFTMGSPANEEGRSADEGPQRKVTIARPFAVGKFEVTFDEWDACVADKGCAHKPGDESWGRGKRPVINVSWDDAKQYVAWLSRKTDQSYRLLTEAEWEYAARAGTTTPFHFGATISTDQSNYDGSYTYGSGKKGTLRQKTIEVGSLKNPNPFGLNDMHGNVWEWAEDCYADSYSKVPTDGSKAPDTKDCSRVLRGGSWNNYPRILRAAFRSRTHPDGRGRGFGFRLARTLIPTP